MTDTQDHTSFILRSYHSDTILPAHDAPSINEDQSPHPRHPKLSLDTQKPDTTAVSRHATTHAFTSSISTSSLTSPITPSTENISTTSYTAHELVSASRILESIASTGTYTGTIQSRMLKHDTNTSGEDEMSDTVMHLVYNTMKFLPYIDHILIKTQFLVFNNQFLDYLGLIKTMVYDLMRFHFNYTVYPGIRLNNTDLDDEKEHVLRYSMYDVDGIGGGVRDSVTTLSGARDSIGNDNETSDVKNDEMDLVKSVSLALYHHRIKLSATYARLRIQTRAAGDTPAQQLYNMLPEMVRDRDTVMNGLHKPCRVRSGTIDSVWDMIRGVVGEDVSVGRYDVVSRMDNMKVYVDTDYPSLIYIPSNIYTSIKHTPIITQGHIMYQDKSVSLVLDIMKRVIKDGWTVMDARSGCGVKTIGLGDTVVGKDGKVVACEHRVARLSTLKSNLLKYGSKNTSMVEHEFTVLDPHDTRYSDIRAILIEPPNSGTMIIDKLGYMIQEEEFPEESVTVQDLVTYKRQQLAMLHHAFKFPNVDVVVYVTRSMDHHENEDVVTETRDRYRDEWGLVELSGMDHLRSRDGDGEMGWIKVEPSVEFGNGVFVACFMRRKEEAADVEEEGDEEGLLKSLSRVTIHDDDEGEAVHKKKVRGRRRRSTVTGATRDSVTSVRSSGSAKMRGRNSITVVPRLSRTIRESVERLSVPRVVSMEIRVRERLNRMRESVRVHSDDELGREEEDVVVKKTVSMDDIEVGRRRSRVVDEGVFADISVFGVSLSKFYGPRTDALKQMGDEAAKTLKYKYPVPNPKPWK